MNICCALFQIILLALLGLISNLCNGLFCSESEVVDDSRLSFDINSKRLFSESSERRINQVNDVKFTPQINTGKKQLDLLMTKNAVKTLNSSLTAGQINGLLISVWRLRTFNLPKGQAMVQDFPSYLNKIVIHSIHSEAPFPAEVIPLLHPPARVDTEVILEPLECNKERICLEEDMDRKLFLEDAFVTYFENNKATLLTSDDHIKTRFLNVYNLKKNNDPEREVTTFEFEHKPVPIPSINLLIVISVIIGGVFYIKYAFFKRKSVGDKLRIFLNKTRKRK